MNIRNKVSTKTLCTVKTGGIVSFVLDVLCLDDLVEAGQFILDKQLPYALIGNGSNVLFSDLDQESILIRIKMQNDQSNRIDLEHKTFYSAMNQSLGSLLRFARQNNIAGFERLAGIPGNVGGALCMNAGTHLGEASDLIDTVYLYDLLHSVHVAHKVMPGDYAYRKNTFVKKHQVITGCDWNLKFCSVNETALNIQKEVLMRRKRTQPLRYPSFGSVFANPINEKAWDLIDKAGLKGHSTGDAQISLKHSNWMINKGNAKSQDMFDLIDLCQNKVMHLFNIELKTEVKSVVYKHLKI